MLASITKPVEVADIGSQLRSLADGAKGIDGVLRSALRCVPYEKFAAHFNLWLLYGCPPSSFHEAYTSVMHEAGDSSKPENYRPITVATMIERLFHQVLAHRLMVMPISLKQKAFCSDDDLYSNIMLLGSLV